MAFMTKHMATLLPNGIRGNRWRYKWLLFHYLRALFYIILCIFMVKDQRHCESVVAKDEKETNLGYNVTISMFCRFAVVNKEQNEKAFTLNSSSISESFLSNALFSLLSDSARADLALVCNIKRKQIKQTKWFNNAAKCFIYPNHLHNTFSLIGWTF